VNQPEFEKEMGRQVERSRAASKFETAAGASDRAWEWVAPATEATKHSEFTGYECLADEVRSWPIARPVTASSSFSTRHRSTPRAAARWPTRYPRVGHGPDPYRHGEED
jgi:hypothetical protein